MKSLSKQQIAYTALEDEEAVFDDEDVNEILYEKWVVEYERRVEEETRKRWARWAEYFFDGICINHDRVGCPQCSWYANGNCPSAKEELPHYF